MSRIARIVAIVRADFLVRFRRASTAVIFLLLGLMAYAWVPDPSTGRALIQIGNQRALYNSAAISMATAVLASLFIGLVGFYVISNAIRRDVASRCGFVLASTTMRGSEYIAGKFLGNLLFLVTFVAGYMVTSMVMVLVRGEGPLEPGIFAMQYLWIVPPVLVMVSVLAILFESVPLLRGRFGDVVYFFVWLGSFGVVATAAGEGSPPFIAQIFDYSGVAFLMDQLKTATGTTQVSIGSSNFDPARGTYLFEGFHPTGMTALARLGAAFTPLPLLLVARLFFHRFDPVRVKARAGHARHGWLAGFNRLLKPLSRVLGLLPPPSRASFFRSAVEDARVTLAAMPVMVLVIAGFALAGLASTNVLPLAFAAFGVLIADVPVRERRSGVLLLTHSAPYLRERFALWKFTAMLVLGVLFFAIPSLRIGAFFLPALLVGIVFVCAAATFLGTVSANAKTFIVVFLTFWYLVMNDSTHPPALDFAGFNGTATAATTAAYAALAVVFLAGAHFYDRWRTERA